MAGDAQVTELGQLINQQSSDDLKVMLKKAMGC